MHENNISLLALVFFAQYTDKLTFFWLSSYVIRLLLYICGIKSVNFRYSNVTE